jgi:LPXTG-motif cell wall-anchored protein
MALVRKLAVAGALAIASLVPLASVAHAQSIDYGETCNLTVSPPPPFAAGSTVTVSGTGFQPNFTTEILFDGAPATAAGVTATAPVTTDALGNFSIDIVIPETAAAGFHTISAICSATSSVPAEIEIEILAGQVTSTTTGGRTTTPRTGSDSAPLAVAGLAAVLAGSAIVLATRRRRAEAVRS